MVGETSNFGRLELSWDAINASLNLKLNYEPNMVGETYGYQGLDSVFDLVEACMDFHKIIFAKPSTFLPSVVNAFFYNWNMMGKSIYTHSITLSRKDGDHYLNSLEGVLSTFNLKNYEAVEFEDISQDHMQVIYDRVSINQEKFVLMTFKRNTLRPKYSLHAAVLARLYRES